MDLSFHFPFNHAFIHLVIWAVCASLSKERKKVQFTDRIYKGLQTHFTLLLIQAPLPYIILMFKIVCVLFTKDCHHQLLYTYLWSKKLFCLASECHGQLVFSDKSQFSQIIFKMSIFPYKVLNYLTKKYCFPWLVSDLW